MPRRFGHGTWRILSSLDPGLDEGAYVPGLFSRDGAHVVIMEAVECAKQA